MRMVMADSDHRCALRGSHTPMEQRGETTPREQWCKRAGPLACGASERSCGLGGGGGEVKRTGQQCQQTEVGGQGVVIIFCFGEELGFVLIKFGLY